MSNAGVGTKSELNKRRNIRLPETVTGVYTFVMLAVFPFLMGKTLFYKMTVAKFVWFVGLTIAYIIAVLIALGITGFGEKRDALGKSKRKIRLTPAQAAVITYMIWGIASAVSSDFGSEAIIGQGRYEGLLSMLLYGISFVFISFWGGYNERLPKGIAVFGILQGLLVAVQLSGLPIPAGLSYFGTGGFIGTLGNIDCMGGMVALTVPALFAAYVVMECTRRWILLVALCSMMFIEGYIWVDSALVGLIVSLIFSLPFLVTDKKGMQRTFVAFAALFAGMAAGTMFVKTGDAVSFMFGKKALVLMALAAISIIQAAVFSRMKEFGLERKKVGRIVALVMAFLVIISLAAIYMYRGDVRLLKEASEVLHGRLSDTAGSGRGIVWKYCLELIPTVPILGTGPGTFYGAFAKYNKMLADAGSTVYFDFAHNDFLQIAICLGIIGLIIYSVFVSMLAVNALRIAKDKPLILIFAAGCAGYLVHSFFSFSIAIVTPGFWVMAGMLDNMTRHDKR